MVGVLNKDVGNSTSRRLVRLSREISFKIISASKCLAKRTAGASRHRVLGPYAAPDCRLHGQRCAHLQLRRRSFDDRIGSVKLASCHTKDCWIDRNHIGLFTVDCSLHLDHSSISRVRTTQIWMKRSRVSRRLSFPQSCYFAAQ